MKSKILLTCLDRIEEQESRALVWCIADGMFRASDLEDLILRVLEEFEAIGVDEASIMMPDQVVSALVDLGLLVRIESEAGESYFRSRMAETVRLVSQLRQLFPRHRGHNAWMRAPNLVADYRLVRRPRRYPKRDQDAVTFLRDMEASRENASVIPWLRLMLVRDAGNMRLSGFQVRSLETILRDMRGPRSRAAVVCAGTGSGKTLAFYLPALARVCADIEANPDQCTWTKVVAVYPRTELLKDQISEVFRESLPLSRALTAKNGRRGVTIGALYAATPNDAHSILEGKKWKKRGDGYVCPYLTCPDGNCAGSMIWREIDVRNKEETLVCSSCGVATGRNSVILTRNRLQANPPDILFTTTEMLNQRLSDPWMHRLFGIGASRPPHMCLLDEVHTYSETHGAMVAYLMRRWRYLVGKPMTFVGLSATLREAAGFFGSLVGLDEHQVTEVAPTYEELESDGIEYMLAVRGDPVSRTALLSTTIQTAMLVARCLDPRDNPRSDGLYGSKTFLFTDDIDVTNRLYFNLLDAEGRNSDGSAGRGAGLAILRQETGDHTRYLAGQDWRFCEILGHDLRSRLEIGRTSSQDAGVDTTADIIVATAALEVGFNDPAVGAVIQHKAPRGVDQFLQRKGRAGRSRRMRPWTVVVLSDYGRDRMTYQGYDALFDPELDVRTLPLSNRHVRRMQVTYALIDYLGSKPQEYREKKSVWISLSGPGEGEGRRAQMSLCRHLEEILLDEGALNELRVRLSRALGLDPEAIDALLWEAPRPLLTTVIPTALRRLKANWQLYDKSMEPHRFNSPLPEFIPATLFSDLELPEVRIVLPSDRNARDGLNPAMSVQRALKEYAPGRVSHRFGVSHLTERHWVCYERADDGNAYAHVDKYCTASDMGHVVVCGAGGCENVPMLRPYVISVDNPPRSVKDSSNSRPAWGTNLIPARDGVDLTVPQVENWRDFVSDVVAYLHANRNPLRTRRFVHQSVTDVRHVDGREDNAVVTFRDARGRVALGFETEVDAVRISTIVPEDLLEDATAPNSEKWRALRVARYFEAAKTGNGFASVANAFARDWLAQIQLAAITCHAARASVSLAEAVDAVHDGETALQMTDVLVVLFQSAEEQADPDNSRDFEDSTDKLRHELRAYLGQPDVREDLRRLAAYLFEPIDVARTDWATWIAQRYVSTVAAACMDALRSLCPSVDDRQVLVDIGRGSGGESGGPDSGCCLGDTCEIWISEACSGGGGYIEEFVRRYVEDPRRYFTLVRAALEPSELERTDAQMRSAIALLANGADQDLSGAVRQFREAITPVEKDTALRQIRSCLESQGIQAYHSFVVALCHRLLKPGTHEDFDRVIRDCVERWFTLEADLGIEIDNRVIAYLLSEDTPIESVVDLHEQLSDEQDRQRWRFDALYGVFWPRGIAVRAEQLRLYSPYVELPAAEPLLCRSRLEQRLPSVELTPDDCETQAGRIVELLGSVGEVVVTIPAHCPGLAKQLFGYIMTNPADVCAMMCYPRLRAVRRLGGIVRIELEISEVIQ